MPMMPYQSLASQSNPCFRLFKKALASLFKKALASLFKQALASLLEKALVSRAYFPAYSFFFAQWY